MTGIDPRTSPHVRRALLMLANGEWQDYNQVVDEMAKAIPPGRAIRRAETARTGVRAGAPAERVRERSTDMLIHYGARALARDALCNDALFEINPRGRVKKGEPKQVRLTPAVAERLASTA